MTPGAVTLSVDLPNEDVAYQLAQFCKRSTFDMFYELTEPYLSHEERKDLAYQMIAGIQALQAALARESFSPR